MRELEIKQIIYLINVLRSEPVLSQQLIRVQVEHIQSVRTYLYSRFFNSYRSSI